MCRKDAREKAWCGRPLRNNKVRRLHTRVSALMHVVGANMALAHEWRNMLMMNLRDCTFLCVCFWRKHVPIVVIMRWGIHMFDPPHTHVWGGHQDLMTLDANPTDHL